MEMEITTTSATVNTASDGSTPGFFEGVVSSLIRLIAFLYMFVAGHWGREHSILPAWAEGITLCTLLAIIGSKWSSKLGRLPYPKPTLPYIYILVCSSTCGDSQHQTRGEKTPPEQGQRGGRRSIKLLHAGRLHLPTTIAFRHFPTRWGHRFTDLTQLKT